jgi:Leucine-rich repeat (LRR) protein
MKNRFPLLLLAAFLTAGLAMLVGTVLPVHAEGDVTADFTDPVFRDYVIEQFDVAGGGNGNGRIEPEEVAEVSALTVSAMGISDLAGIEHFEGLTSLACNNNELVQLDVSGLANLRYLICAFNDLTSLDVSGLTHLTELNCGGNALTSLDISGLTNLTELDCSVNALTSLDVSGLTNLYRLYCYRNSLTQLDISGLLNLRYLVCNDNSLAELKLSGMRDLTGLSCYDNDLTELDVSGAPKLESLLCYRNKLSILDVSGLANLIQLSCNENDLTELNVSGRQQLTLLRCDRNNLTELDLYGLTSLLTLECYENNLTELDLSGLAKLYRLFCQGNHLTQLDLSMSNILFASNYNASEQNLALGLRWNYAASRYEGEIALSSPGGFAPGVAYLNGRLTASDNTQPDTDFTAETGRPGLALSGKIALSYERTDDFGNRFEDAHVWALAAGVTNSLGGVVEQAGDVDMLRFTAPSTGEYTFRSSRLAAGLRYLDGYLYDGSKRLLAKHLPPAKKPFAFRYALTRGRTYFVKLDGLHGTGAYTLEVVAPSKEDDYGDTFGDAQTWDVAAGTVNSLPARIEESKDADMFCFTAPSSGLYTCWVTDKADSLLYLDGYIYDSARTKLAGQLVSARGSFNFQCQLERGQTYYFKADGYYGFGGYTLNIQAAA